MPIHWRITFEQPTGYAHTHGPLPVEWVPIGDRRFVPRVIFARFQGDEHPGTAPAPDLELLIEIRDGVPSCREVRIIANDEGREVKPADLSKVRLSEWVTDIVGNFSTQITPTAAGFSVGPHPAPESAELAEVVQRVHRLRTKRRRLTREFLTRVAEVYRTNIGDRPTTKVAETFGAAPRTAAGWVQQAREEGLLPKTTKGKKRA